MRTLAIGTLLGAGLVLGGCKEKAKVEAGGGAATAEEAKETESHALVVRGSRLPAKGSSLHREHSEHAKGTMSIDTGPQKMEGTTGYTESEVETWVYLEDRMARRTLESKSAAHTLIVAGQDKAPPAEKDPLIGVPVIVIFKDGRYLAKVESGTATADQTTALGGLCDAISDDSELTLYGETPRKVGDKWNVDATRMGTFAGAENLSGTFTMEFIKIEEFQGIPCAVLKSKFDLTGSPAGDKSNGWDKMKIKVKGEAIAHRSLADTQDLEVKINAVTSTDGSPNPQMQIHMEGTLNMTTEIKATK